MRGWLTVCVAVGILALGVAAGAEWQPAQGPLATQWARDVSATNAHPEYPRPQMVRRDWLNLNGLWDYAVRPRAEAQPTQYDGQILVPFPIESALSGVMKPVDEKSRLWYRRTFEVPEAWRGQRLLLHFGAVDWEATVYLNGQEVGVHRGGYDTFSFDITDILRPSGPQEIVIAVFDPTDHGTQPIGKQRLRPGGIWYTSTTGIWQTVWLEPVPASSIRVLRLVPDVEGSCLRLRVGGVGTRTGHLVEAIASEGGREVGRAAGPPDSDIRVPIPNAKLWSPDNPFLYDLKVTLRDGEKALDSVDSYFGMRKIALGKDDKGFTRLLLNGQFVFQIGPLAQGFWPDGIYAAPTDAAIRHEVEMMRKLGFNMARKHVMVEPDRYYYWCDKLGVMIWQDMPSMFVGPPKGRKDAEGKEQPPAPEALKRYEDAKKQFEVELRQMVETHWNHPSIVMWVVFNEGWGQYDTERLTAWVKEMDPSRLVNNASGWSDCKVGDVMDIHAYPGPAIPKLEPTRAAVLGEFGGLGLEIPGHTWIPKKSWGYRGMADTEQLTRNYVKLLRRVWQLKDQGLCAAVYTQITDVEVECNGLLTYDRAVVKGDLARLADANLGRVPQIKVTVLLPTSEQEPQTWLYTLAKPADDWFKADFDASGWKSGPGGFGTKGTPGSVVRTEWRTPDIWLRREFTLPEGKLDDAQLWMHHDEDAEVYINGVLASKTSGFTSAYEEFALTAEGKAALRPGRNVLAVHCRQTQGGQYIDVGLVRVTELPAPGRTQAPSSVSPSSQEK